MKKLIFIFILVMMGCAGEDGRDGADRIEGGWTDATTDTPLTTVSNPTGYAEAASCLKRGDITLTALDADYKQLNDYTTTTKDNRGKFKVNADVAGVKARTSFRGWCARETASGTVYMSMEAYHDLDDNDNNVNIPGTIQSELAQYYADDVDHENYEDKGAALGTAKTDVLEYFGFNGFTAIDFSNGSIQGDTTNDAIVTLVSSIVDSRHSTGPEMNDDMSTIAYSIYTADAALKTELAGNKSALKLKDIKDRLTGLVGSSPPIWSTEFGFESYYGDLFGRTPVEQASKNKTEVSSGGIGLSTYSLFQWPIRFTDTGKIEASRYIVLNIDNGDLSIWTKGGTYNGYNIRGSKLVDLVKLNEVLLSGGNSNYDLGDSHGLTTGTDYILIQSKSTPSDQATLITGDSVPFSQNSASDDGGATWLPSNVTARFTTSIKWVLFD